MTELHDFRKTASTLTTAVQNLAEVRKTPGSDAPHLRLLRFLCSFVAIVSAFSALPVSAAEPQAFRAARSVHWGWAAPDATLFYNEMIVDQSTTGSFFMACGWNTGYFGIQELGNGRKVAIFSVWDPSKGDDPNAVTPEQRVDAECCTAAA